MVSFVGFYLALALLAHSIRATSAWFEPTIKCVKSFPNQQVS